jgi:acetylglutamate kinase
MKHDPHSASERNNVSIHVLKIGGNELSAPGFLPALAAAVRRSAKPTVIVHGGGKAIAALQAQLGLETKKIEGLRVTDAPSLAVAQMVLSGSANKQIVTALLAAGVRAVGLSGVDGGLISCRKKKHPNGDLGFVGEAVAVHADILHHLLNHELTPVISPISLGTDGQTYNVNADEAAAAVAKGLQAELLDFVSNVPGVQHDGDVITDLTWNQCEALIDAGVIAGGMIPKVRAALDAVEKGVSSARIVDLGGLANGGGTCFGRTLEPLGFQAQ